MQRNVKFLKYLSRLGWATSVVTPKPYEFHVFDPSLLNELDESTEVTRTESLDPLRVTRVLKDVGAKEGSSPTEAGRSSIKNNGFLAKAFRFVRSWFMFPDQSMGWIPFAIRAGNQIVANREVDIVFGSFPGPTNAVIAYYISKAKGVPFILDFRDGWIDDPYTRYPSRFHYSLHVALEKRILSKAAGIVVYGDVLKKRFEDRYPKLGSIAVIPNGFDPADLKVEGQLIQTEESTIQIVYSGSLFGKREDNFRVFIKALSLLPEELKERIRFTVVGPKFNGVDTLIASHALEKQIRITGYVAHKVALKYLATADAGVVFLPPGEFTGVTGKVFEYLGFQLPVIACVEGSGACADLLASINWAFGIAQPDSSEQIADVIVDLEVRQWPRLEKDVSMQFSRAAQSDALSEYMNNIIIENTK